MFQYIVLFSTIFGSLFVGRVLRENQKWNVIPFCVAYSFALAATVGSIGGVLHFLFTVFNFVIVMCLCNGFCNYGYKLNDSWKSFCIFYGYMFIIVFTGYFPITGACEYAMVFLKTFASGYFLALWMMHRERALSRVLSAMLLGCWFVILFNVMHGGLSAQTLDATGRGGFIVGEDAAEINVNMIALTVSCFLPFLMIILCGQFWGKHNRLIKLAANVAFVFCTLIIIRTGSRNGTLALLPCGWYFIVSARTAVERSKRAIMGVLIISVLAIGIFVTMGGGGSLRAFDFRGKSEEFNTTGHTDFSNGRLAMYENALSRMSPLEKIIGKGFSLTDNIWRYDEATKMYVRIERLQLGNAHSMIMSIFYRSGWIGLLLFIIFAVASIKKGLSLGFRGRIAVLLMGVWLATGVGEAWGIIGGNTAILAGIAMGFLSKRLPHNSELLGLNLE